MASLNADTKTDIRRAVALAVRYWPNAHLGDHTPSEDMRSAFRMLRSHAERHGDIYAGIGAVETDAYRHADL